jgi:DNA polymerase-1
VDDKTNVWLTFTVDKEGFSTQVDELNAKFNIDASSLEIPNNVFEVTKDLVKPFYGVEASGVVDLKALMGDTADNIPGVKGIGEKTANILVDKFKTIENLYGYIEGNNEEDVCAYFKECGIKSSKKVYSVLTAKDNNGIAGKEAALLSKQLATIKTDINLGELPLEVFETKINEDNLITSLKRLQFNSLLNYYNN